MSSEMNNRRILVDIEEVRRSSEAARNEITVESISHDTLEVHLSMCGPAWSSFADEKLNVIVQFPASYPFSAPVIIFSSNHFHLKGSSKKGPANNKNIKWSAGMTLIKILILFQSLLCESNSETRTNHYSYEFNKTANGWSKKYTMIHDHETFLSNGVIFQKSNDDL